MTVCANSLICAFLISASSFSYGTDSENQAYYLDPRQVVPFNHLFNIPGSSESIALTFINDVMESETARPPKCDFIGFKNDTRPEEPTAKFDIVCAKIDSFRPAAFIGIQPVRFETSSRKISQYEVADHYARQLEGMDWEKRIRAHKNQVPILSILVSHFEPERVDRLVKHSKMLDTWNHENLYTGFTITTMYLDKCRERVQRDSDVLRNHLDKWCHFFRYAVSYRVGEVPAWAKDDDVWQMAYSELDPRKYTSEELKAHNETLQLFEQNYDKYKEIVKQGRWKGGVNT